MMVDSFDGRRVVEFPSNLDANGYPVCPHCGCDRSKVVNTYKIGLGKRRRRRECDNCQLPFFTVQPKEEVEEE